MCTITGVSTNICARCGTKVRAAIGECPRDGSPLQPIDTLEVEPDPTDPLVGYWVLDRYKVLRRLSRGAHGVVYLAMHGELRRAVALKILDSCGDSDGWSTAAGAFSRGDVAAAQIDPHPNVLSILDAGRTPDAGRYVVKELLHGSDLAELMNRQKLAPTWVVGAILHACRGLAAVHAAGLVHRDVKPQNLFWHDPSPGEAKASVEHVLKVIDFGVACRIDEDAPIAGTPEYMAPEQYFSGPLDARTDVFALGVTLYRLLTGRFPFVVEKGDRLLANQRARMTQEPIRPCAIDATLSSDLEAVIMRAMARPAEARFEDMQAFESALRRTPEGQRHLDPSRTDARALDKELSARATSFSHLGRTISIMYPNDEGVSSWQPSGSLGPRLVVLRDRAVKVDPSHVLLVGGHRRASLIVHDATNWEITVHRRAGGEALDISLHGGATTSAGAELNMGGYGTFRAVHESRPVLLGLAAPTRSSAAIVCIA